MAHSYPIWNDVEACIYNSNKSFGAKQDSKIKTYVGSSASNSELLVETRITKSEKDEYKKFKDVIVFRFSVDGIILKEKIFKNNKGRAGKLLKSTSKMKSLKSL